MLSHKVHIRRPNPPDLSHRECGGALVLQNVVKSSSANTRWTHLYFVFRTLPVFLFDVSGSQQEANGIGEASKALRGDVAEVRQVREDVLCRIRASVSHAIVGQQVFIIMSAPLKRNDKVSSASSMTYSTRTCKA